MRTFHTGGIAGEDITHGLPRVAELFEARVPKGVAPISEAAGRVRIEEASGTKAGGRKIVITPDDGTEEIEYPILRRARLLVTEGQHGRGRSAARRRCGKPARRAADHGPA